MHGGWITLGMNMHCVVLVLIWLGKGGKFDIGMGFKHGIRMEWA